VKKAARVVNEEGWQKKKKIKSLKPAGRQRQLDSRTKKKKGRKNRKGGGGKEHSKGGRYGTKGHRIQLPKSNRQFRG